jgi:hypothetical protein
MAGAAAAAAALWRGKQRLVVVVVDYEGKITKGRVLNSDAGQLTLALVRAAGFLEGLRVFFVVGFEQRIVNIFVLNWPVFVAEKTVAHARLRSGSGFCASKE